jgi:hypothetical protein
MRGHPLLALVVALLGLSLFAGQAAAHPPGVRQEVKRIIRDCARNDRLDHHYSLKGLRRALRVLPDDVRYYTNCERAIKRAIRQAQRKRFREVFRIYRDCARDDDLDGRYSLAGLRLALRWLPDDLRYYTGCERAIKRGIRHARKPHHRGHHRHHPGRRVVLARAT